MRKALWSALPLVVVAATAVADDYQVVESATSLYKPPPTKPKSSKLDFTKITRLIAPKADQKRAPVATTLPVDFPFFGRIYPKGQALSVSEDGWLAFGALSGNATPNPQLPSDDPRVALMAPLWDDLQTGPRGQVVTWIDGADVVFAWLDVDNASAATADDVSFEIVLHPTSGNVDFAYSRDARHVWRGLSYTVGIESEGSAATRRVFPDPGDGNVPNDGVGRPASDLTFVPMTVSVTGSVTRDRPTLSPTTGLGAVTDSGLPHLPVAFADVQLLDSAGTVVGTGRTDATGAFTATSFGYDGPFSVRLLASGQESRVTRVDGSTWSRVIATGLVHAPSDPPQSPPALAVAAVHLGAAADSVDAFREALNIQQAARRGYDWAVAAIAASALDAKTSRESFTRLEFRYEPGTTTSGYAAATSSTTARATIAGPPASAGDDAYDDYVVIREYAQHLLASMETWPGNLVQHVWDPNDPPPPAVRASQQQAFADGFSFFFATSAMATPWSASPQSFVGDSRFVDSKGTGTAPTLFDLNAPDAVGPDVAGAIAASLWDLVDGVDPGAAAFDRVQGTFPGTAQQIFTTLDERTSSSGTVSLPTGAPTWNSTTFFNAWIALPTTTQKLQTTREFVHHQTLPDDSSDFPNPNDAEDATIPAFTPSTPNGQKMLGLVLNPFNVDQFKFTFAAASPQIAVQWGEATTIAMTIRDASGATVLAGPVSNSGPQTGVVSPPAAGSSSIVFAGVQGVQYVVRLEATAGPTAHYTLSISPPVALASPVPDGNGVSALADATVDKTYSAAVGTSGGFGSNPAAIHVTYRFDDKTAGFDGSVPGLAISPRQGGFDLTGTPTTAGRYKLRVLATDDSGAVDRFIGILSLRVNGAASMKRVFAVATGAAADFDVGTGGTGATWTLTSPRLVSGFTMTDGATLHVAGSSSVPASFDVTGYTTGEAFQGDVGSAAKPATAEIVVVPYLAAFAPRGKATKLSHPSAPFGFAFDAVAGSDFSLDATFEGSGDAPKLAAILDSAGASVGPASIGSARARPRVHVAGFKLTKTGTYFVVFDAASTFDGTVIVRGSPAVPPKRFSAVANVLDASSSGLLTFSVVPNSTIVVTLRKGRAPTAAAPGGIALRLAADDPAGPTVFAGNADGSAVFTFDSIPALAAVGPYALRFFAAAGQSGPLLCEVVVTPPSADTLSTHFLR